MNHIECSRCAAQFPHPLALLEHHDTVHGGWAVRYPDEKPLEPDPTRLEEKRALNRASKHRTYWAKKRAVVLVVDHVVPVAADGEMVRQYLAAGSEELYHTPVGHGRRW